MLVWLVFAVLAALVVALVIWPLAGSQSRSLTRAAYDRAVYRDQLKEIDRDVERGVLTTAEAASARLEVERRLLAAADKSGRSVGSAVSPLSRMLTIMLAVLVPLGAMAIYLVNGSPQLPDQPYEARAADRAVTANGGLDLDKTVAALEARLKAEPGSVEGWILLARAQAQRKHWQESADAYHQAMTLAKDRTDLAAAYAEMLVMAADGIVSPAARQALDAVTAQDPKNPLARYYLALAEAQSGNSKAAIDAWQALLADSPADAPWAALVRQRIADTAKAAGIPAPAPPVGTPTSPGPSADDVAAAAQLSPEQRNEMIRGMVERLAARLKDAPGDLQGWLRLGRAYDVLKEPDKAADAYAQAAKLKPDDPAILASEVDAMMADRSPTEPIPDTALVVLKQLKGLDANEPRALWYLGLAAAQAHEIDEAKAYWQKLLTVLPPDSADRKMVSDALAALSN